ncbi:hypothetical protein FB451DRAFT_1373530 [Mycena latifolia]|nr:hypothetical protein FB451DRAFT_1373530 [Mycena latifolia]
MENDLGTEYEGSLFTPPGSPTPTSAPSLPSPTVEGHASFGDLLDNWDTVLGDDGMVTFVAKAAVDTARALSPPISGSQSIMAEPHARTWAATAPTQAAAQWQNYSIPNYYLESVQEPSYQHSFAPAGLPPLPVWPVMDPAPSAAEDSQAMSQRVTRSLAQGRTPAGRTTYAFLHHDIDSRHSFAPDLPRTFRGHQVANKDDASPTQMGPYAHALPPCGTTSRLVNVYPSSALAGVSATTAMVAHATATDAAYGGQFKHYSQYPPPPQAPGGTYGAQSSAFGRSQDAYGQLPAYGNYPSNMIWPPIPESAANHSRQPTPSNALRFIPALQQFALPPSSAPQYTEAATSSWARAHGGSGNATQIPAASSSHALLAGSSVRPSAALSTSQTKLPTMPAAPSPGAASTSGVPPGLTAWSKKRPAPAVFPHTPLGPHSLEQVLEMAKPNHGNQSYTCKVSTMADGTPSSCHRHDMHGSPAGLQRHLAECHGFPDAAQAKRQHRTYAACVWDSEKPCYKLVALDKMGAHIASCHLKAHYYPCGYCGGQFASKRKYADHFAQSAACLAHVSAREGPPEKRRRVDEAGEGDF